MEGSREQKQNFKQLVDAGLPVGEVIGVSNFLVTVKGLHPISSLSVVVFEDGSRGYVNHVLEDSILVLHLGATPAVEGMLLVAQGTSLTAPVGKDFVGRVISVTGAPLDGKGAIAPDGQWPVFHNAPPIHEREFLNTQLETGVTMIDTLFPIVRGQRLALLGDTKSGKSILATQIAINQKNTDQIVVYVMIAKRRSDVNMLLSSLTDSGAIKKAIVIVSNVFDSLVTSYLAPYVGAAMAEYLWQQLGQDTLIIYDDLTTHAYACREIALLAGTSPGRDSYPGDIFFSHSSLLERAGKLIRNHKCLTSIPVVLADGGDITAYLPTNIMSITDGQWILDMEIFRSSLRPAISMGLSVTRVGGRGHNDRQKKQNETVFKLMSEFEQAQQFAHFGTEISASSQQTLSKGNKLREFFTQRPNEVINLMSQQLALDILLADIDVTQINVSELKKDVAAGAEQVKSDADYPRILESIKSKYAKPRPAAAQPAPAAPSAAASPGVSPPATSAPAQPAPAAPAPPQATPPKPADEKKPETKPQEAAKK